MSQLPSSTLPLQPPSLQEATKRSTVAWQNDLEALFHLAKDRFPDVVWELLADDSPDPHTEEVWGHKAIVYARAPPSFQARYFSFRPAPISSPGLYTPTPYPAQSALSLNLGADLPAVSRSPSPFRAASPAPSTNQGGILRLQTSINPTLFSKELEYLYTGKGFGEAFEFLFDSAEHREEGDAEENRIDKLRKDLVFMWRSRLYSDVRVTIEGASAAHEGTAAVFSTHRFILVSRSAYFHNALIAWGTTPKPSEPLSLALPSPPFTPPALHFILGFIYTGTLIFSNRSYDLDTAFHIMRSATYLSLDTLYDEIQARIVQEMMHGLYHAFLDFTEYERVTGGKWGVGGCRCKQCARRVPRVLEFALLEDVKNTHIERGARRALVGLFGEGWCYSEFAHLDKKTRESILKGIAKRTTPLNVFQLLYAAQAALHKLESNVEVWADTVRDMITEARKTIDHVFSTQSEECFEQQEWLEIMEADAARFDDGERVEWIMDALRRGFSEKSAGKLYQTLVDCILTRTPAADPSGVMLSATSHIRVQVEQTRVDLVQWIRRRWVGVRQEGGFDDVPKWALSEIAGDIGLNPEDLAPSSSPPSTRGSPTRTGPRSTNAGKGDADQESIGVHSLRTSVLNRNMAKQHVSSSRRDTVQSSASSIRSIARSTHSVASQASTVSVSIPRRISPSLGPRPDSKLTPSNTTSIARTASSFVTSASPTTVFEEAPGEPSAPIASASSSTAGSSSTVNGQRTPIPRLPKATPLDRPKSSAASIKSTTASVKSSVVSVRSSTVSSSRNSTASVSSVRSRASTIRKPSSTLTTPSVPSIRVPSTATSRTSSSVSRPATSESSSTFKSAKSDLAGDATLRVRRPSVSSSVSTASVRTSVASTKPAVRPRRASAASTTSVISTTAKVKKPATLDSGVKRGPITARSPSVASVRSTASTSPTIPKKTLVARKPPLGGPAKSMDSIKPKAPPASRESPSKGKERALAPASPVAFSAKTTSSSTDVTPKTARELKPKRSSDTITKATPAASLPRVSPPVDDGSSPRGASLEIGIPCIISSKRARFRAFARYIGEVEGELGPWVGVEVPVGDSWSPDQLDTRQWNDGTWGGVRYFDLGNGLEWDYGDDRATRRRRLDPVGSLTSYNATKGLKREGDQLSIDRSKRFRAASPAVSDVTMTESRGLFVRPQQVLYVIDAVGSDL